MTGPGRANAQTIEQRLAWLQVKGAKVEQTAPGVTEVQLGDEFEADEVAYALEAIGYSATVRTNPAFSVVTVQ